MPLRSLAAVVLTASIGLAACLPSATNGPVASPGNSGMGASTAPSPPTQSETDFGLVWDATPLSFPAYPGAVPATEAGLGPASALLAVDAADPDAVATFYRDVLGARGMVASVDGPLEDGARIVSGSNAAGCEVEVDVRPTGTTTFIVVLYGAGCPFA